MRRERGRRKEASLGLRMDESMHGDTATAANLAAESTINGDGQKVIDLLL